MNSLSDNESEVCRNEYNVLNSTDYFISYYGNIMNTILMIILYVLSGCWVASLLFGLTGYRIVNIIFGIAQIVLFIMLM